LKQEKNDYIYYVLYIHVQNKCIHIEVGVTIKERNANKTILFQLFLRDVVSGLVPAGEKNNLFLHIGATSWLSIPLAILISF